MLAGAQILRDDWPHGPAQCKQNPERHRHQPVDDGEGCDHRLAILRKHPHHPGRGHRRRQIGGDGGQSHAGHRAQILQHMSPFWHGDEIVNVDHAPQAHGGEHGARDDGGHSRAVHAHAKAKNQQRIERRRNRAAPQRHIHRAASVAHRAQGARQRRAQSKERVGGQGYQQKAGSDFERLPARAQHGDQLAPERQGDKRDDDRNQKNMRQARSAIATRPLTISRANIARHQSRDGDGQTDAYRDHKEHDLRGVTNARSQVGVAKPRNIQQRQQVDHEHCDQPHRACGRHHRHMAHDGAFRKHGAARGGSGRAALIGRLGHGLAKVDCHHNAARRECEHYLDGAVFGTRTCGPHAGWKPAVQRGALWTAGVLARKRRKPWLYAPHPS